MKGVWRIVQMTVDSMRNWIGGSWNAWETWLILNEMGIGNSVRVSEADKV
jgi:hypothetical protein